MFLAHSFRYKNSYITVDLNRVSQHEASRACTLNGGSLVSITDKNKQQRIETFLRVKMKLKIDYLRLDIWENRQEAGFWIGAERGAARDDWRWPDNSSIALPSKGDKGWQNWF